MNDLIKRLEEATEWSRELDADIYEAMGNTVFRAYGVMPVRDKDFGPIPAYTFSLDTAVTLVPEGIAWTVSKLFNNRFWASCDDPEDYDNSWAVSAEKPTPALALCIAALRARLVMENGGLDSTPD